MSWLHQPPDPVLLVVRRTKGCPGLSEAWCVHLLCACLLATDISVQYCADVLLPEAVLQLHLFRHGHRSSARPLTPKQENRLYEVGQGLMKTEVHWITQIVQLRKLAEGSLNRNTKRKVNAPVAIIEGGTSTRPKTRQG